MSRLTILANIHAHPDKIELVKSELVKLIQPTLAEPGCLNYDLHQNNDDPAHFIFYENWESKACLEGHLNSPHVKQHIQATEGAVASVTLTELTLI